MTRVRIVHVTGYRYPMGATASVNEVRMTPANTPYQRVQSSVIEINPSAWQQRYTDYWGTSVTSFEVHELHERLSVVATSVVDVNRANDPRDPQLDWNTMRSDATAGDHLEMLGQTDWVEPSEELAAIASAIAADAPTPRDAAHRVIAAVRDRVKYVPGFTFVNTRADEAWDAGAGVCQDMVHCAIGALRSIGIPARYVSGYVLPASEPAVNSPQTGESHAWLQFWDGRWVGWDPTNDTAPGDHHVEVGVGREYRDVSPLRGIYSGAGTSDMYVEVEMTVLDAGSGR